MTKRMAIERAPVARCGERPAKTFALLAGGIALLACESVLAQNKGRTSRAEVEASLARLFPKGQRQGHEGVMKLGQPFRTVVARNWEQCRDFCVRNPTDGKKGCIVWTFRKEAEGAPSTCRMWPAIPALRANVSAVSGTGRFE